MRHTMILGLCAALAACGQEQTNAPVDAAAPDAAPSTPSAPDYAAAFPQDAVPRLDIVISAEAWAAMQADMTDMLGAPGSGGPGGPGGPGGMPPFGDGGMPPPFGDGGVPPPFGDGGVPPGGPGGPGGGAIDLLPRTPIYAECTVRYGGASWEHVGVRYKGNSSLAMSWQGGIDKLPLRLTFDRYEDQYPATRNQRFFGFKALSLSNGASDGSLVRDKVGTDVFAAAGIAVPATAFYRVFLDVGAGPVYYGLYTAIELPSDDAFLENRFGTSDGNLYKPDGAGATWQVFDAETLGKENHEDAADFRDAQALFDALHADRSDAAAWRAGLEATLDVDGFLHWLALNAVVEDWDVYGRMAHNYYLYSHPGEGGRFRWIPWDHSFAFTPGGQALSLGLAEVGDQWPLIRYLLDDTSYAARYRALLAEAVSTAYEPAAAEARFLAAHALVEPYAVGAEGELAGHTFLTTPEAFAEAHAALIAHARARHQEVTAFLQGQ
jgi:spore coat protein H